MRCYKILLWLSLASIIAIASACDFGKHQTSDYPPPKNAAISVGFIDTDLDGGQIAGDVTIAKAADESDITHYVLYWGSSGTTKLAGRFSIAIIAKTGSVLTHTLPANTVVPAGATHLLVFTINNDAEMKTGIHALILDKGAPVNAAVSVVFTDSDTSGGQIGGDVIIAKASDESDITNYILYWGTGPGSRMGDPIASLAPTGGNLVHSFVGALIPDGATYLLVFTGNNGVEMAAGVSVLIVDQGAPEYGAAGLNFEDLDLSPGEIEGTLTISRASDETYITYYALYWGTGVDARLGDPIVSIPKENESLTYSFPSDTEVPGGAYYLLVFTGNAGGEMATGASIQLSAVDTGVPFYAAVSVGFTDLDADGGEISGDINIVKADDETNITHYILYWGSDTNTRLAGQAPIESIAKTGGDLASAFSGGTPVPSGATHLLVFTANNGVEMGTGVSVLIVDKGVPTEMAVGINFTDMNPSGGILAGDVSIDRALNEGNLTHYALYWGSSETTTFGPSIAAVPKTGGNLTYLFESVHIPDMATHLLVFTRNGDGEMTTGVGVLITDNYKPVNPAAGVSFTDADIDEDQLAGDVSIDAALDESDVTRYILYWGSEVEARLGAPIATIDANESASYHYYLADNTAIPAEAFYLLVFTGNEESEMATGASVYITDKTPPLKLTAEEDIGEGDRFGRSVAVSGSYAIAGAYANDDDGQDSGSAYIFELVEGESWTRTAKLTAEDAAKNDRFGYSVAIDGDYAVVGAYGDGDGGSYSGAAYVFRRGEIDEAWTQIAKLTANDASAGDSFGYSVSIDGSRIVVGAYSDDNDSSSDAGSAYVFEYGEETWSQTAKLTADDDSTNDYFGHSVAISGDRIVVGAHKDDVDGVDSGSAYIFEYESGWSQTAKLTAENPESYALFGYSVSISDDFVIVGAHSEDAGGIDSGAAYIFRDTGETWEFEFKLTPDIADDLDNFGVSVSINGEYAAAGTINDDDVAENSGAVYLFKREEMGTWTRETKLTAHDGAQEDSFGVSVSIGESLVIVGAYGDGDATPDSGSAYIFDSVLERVMEQ